MRFKNKHPQFLWRGEVVVQHATKKALYVRYENEPAWIPFSLIDAESEIWREDQIGECGILVIPEWLAQKKGWI